MGGGKKNDTVKTMNISHRLIPFVVVGCFIVAALLWFIPSYSVGFLADDYDWLQHVTEAKAESGAFFRLATESIGGATFFRPIINWSFLVDHTLFGFHATPYHIVNIILFGLACGLFALFLQKLTGKISVGIAAGTLFLLNPLSAETVTWIAGRTDLWLLLFLFGALLAFHSYRQRPTAKKLLVLLLLSLGAVFAKENGVVLLPLFALLDVFFFRPQLFSRATFLPYGAFLGVLFVLFLARIVVLGTGISSTNVFGRSNFQIGDMEDLQTFGRFAFFDFFHADAAAWLPFSLKTVSTISLIAFLTIFGSALVSQKTVWKTLLAALLTTLILLTPTLGFVSFVTNEHANVRFLLVPMVGVISLLLALLIGKRFRTLRASALGLLTLLWALASWDGQFAFQRAKTILAQTFQSYEQAVAPTLQSAKDAVLLSNLPGIRDGAHVTPTNFDYALKVQFRAASRSPGLAAPVVMFGNLPLPDSPLCEISNGERAPESVHAFQWDDDLGFSEQQFLNRATFDAQTPVEVTETTVVQPAGFSELIIPVRSWSGKLQGAKTHLRLKLHADEIKNDDYTLPIPITESSLASGAIVIRLCEFPRFFEREEIASWKFDWRGFDDAEVEFGTPYLK